MKNHLQVVFELAELRILEFYSDFLHKYHGLNDKNKKLI